MKSQNVTIQTKADTWTSIGTGFSVGLPMSVKVVKYKVVVIFESQIWSLQQLFPHILQSPIFFNPTKFGNKWELKVNRDTSPDNAASLHLGVPQALSQFLLSYVRYNLGTC